MRFFNGFILILLILLLFSFVSASDKVSKVSNDDFNISTKEIIECNRPDCLINVELCKKNDLKLSKNDLSLYFDNDGKKDVILKIKSKNDKISCEQLSFNIRIPLFSVIKFGLLYESLDLDPFINSTSYEANFTLDINSSSDLIITDLNISGTFTDYGDGLVASFTMGNTSFIDEVGGYTTVNNNVLYNATNGVNANFGGFMYKDGDIGDYVTVDEDILNDLGGNEYTIMAWVYPEDMVGQDIAIFGDFKDGGNYQSGLYVTDDGELRSAQKTGGSTWNLHTGTDYTLEQNSWNHITSVYDGSDVWHYVNGSKNLNYDTTGTELTTRYSLFTDWTKVQFLQAYGTSGTNGDQELFGGIDEVLLFNKVVSDDIISDFASGTVYYPFSAFSGLYVSDAFIVNSSVSNITPFFNGEDVIINISLDNGSSFFNNVTSGVPIELSNSSVLIYRVGFLSVNAWLSDFNISLTVEFPTNINIGVLNVSNNTVDRGEDFLLFINYTNNQQELIPDASCSGTFRHIYQELTNETGINQTIDASNEYSINFSGIEISTTNEFDIISFNVCRASGTNQDLNVNISGDISIITSSNVLLCTDGFNKISINSTQCIDKSSCNITFSKTGNQDYFIIDGFVEHDRFFREHTDIFINNLSEDLYIPHRNYEYYEQGSHEFNASCSKNLFQSQIKTINITALNVDPIVFLQSIDTVIEGFQDFNNNTLTTFANLSIGNITAFIFDLNLLFSNISIINASSGELISSIVNNSVLDFSLRYGTFNISVIANDTFNQSDNDNGFIVVSQCSEDWERTDSCVFPESTTTVNYDDINSCGTFGDFDSLTPVNGSSNNCTYADIEGNIYCDYSVTPNIELFEKIEWICTLNNTGGTTTTCNTFVKLDTQIIQTNPNPEYVEQVGMVNYFTAKPETSNYQTVNVYFKNKDLVPLKKYVFGVRCNSDAVYYNFQVNVTPVYKDITQEIGTRSIWAGRNAISIVAFFIIVFILFIIIGYLILTLRGKQ